MGPVGVISTLAVPAFNPAPERPAVHIKTANRVLIGVSFLYTYTQMGRHVTRRSLLATPLALAAEPNESFPSWPVFDQTEERAMLDTLRSGKWNRGTGGTVNRFEEAYAKLTGTKY